MVDLTSSLATLETELLELKREAKEEKRQAAEKERQLGEQLRIIRTAREAARGLVPSSDTPVGSGAALRTTPTRITDPSDEDDGFVWAAQDQQTGEPIYDVRVVSGYDSNRDRARAAARVYGHQLREGSLAAAIFETGETSAVDVSSARSSLGSIVRYGHEWTRLNGWLYYQGDLRCDVDMVRSILGETAQEERPRNEDDGP